MSQRDVPHVSRNVESLTDCVGVCVLGTEEGGVYFVNRKIGKAPVSCVALCFAILLLCNR